MDTSLVPNSSSFVKYTSSFLNQLQSEWNEFVLEISHSTPHDVISNYSGPESVKKCNNREAFVESLNKFNHSSDGNILIPVPLKTLKKLFSPSKCHVDDVFKHDFFSEIKENLNLSKLSSNKLRKLLSIHEYSEISDFPSPSLPKNCRNSAPPKLFPSKKCKSNPKQKIILDINSLNKVKSENGLKNDFTYRSHVNQEAENNENSLVKIFDARSQWLNNGKEERKSSFNTLKKASENEAETKEKKRTTNGIISSTETNYSCTSVGSIQPCSGSDSSNLFYTLKDRKKSSKPTIVCTYFNQKELSKMYQIVKHLGYYTIENHVSSRTTHLVCGGSNKTINLCKAVARGCWILDKEWITASCRENRWLLEERFEKKSLTPAILENRLKRQKSGSTYRCDVFVDCGSMYVSNECTQPSPQDLRELILLGGGHLEQSADRAAYVIGRYPNSAYIKEIWILNCILQGYVLDVRKYARNKR